MSSEALQDLATRIRRDVVRMTHVGKAAHVASGLSVADILATLYGGILQVDPADPESPLRDRFIMSKGHAAAALYAVLAESGFFPHEWLDTFYQDGSLLCGHVTRGSVPGVDHSTGSLGHGLSVAAGMALAAKRDNHPFRVYALLSDGECDEGSVWEPALFAAHHQLDNLTVIIDYNKIQSLASIQETIGLEPLGEKWSAFGWSVQELDGNDVGALDQSLRGLPFKNGSPSCVVAHTIKGKGVSFMERSVLWHYRSPTQDDVVNAMKELEAAT